MKKQITHAVAIAALALTIGATEAQIQSSQYTFGLPDKTPSEIVRKQWSVPQNSFRHPQNIKRATDGGHKLTIKLKFGEGYPNNEETMVRVLNKDAFEMVFIPAGETEGVLENLPSGKYDILYDFSNPDNNIQYPIKSIIKENVEVNSDTEVLLDSDEASVHLQIDSYNITGEEFIVNNTGNAASMFINNRIIPKESLGESLYSYQLYSDTDVDLERISDIRITPLSERYTIVQIRDITDKKGNFHLIKHKQDGASESKKIANTPSDFILYKEPFTQSPYGKSTNKQLRFGYIMNIVKDKVSSTGQSSVGLELSSDGFAKFYLDIPDDATTVSPTWNIRLQAKFVDYEGEGYDYLTIDGTPINISKDGVTYEVVGRISSRLTKAMGPFFLMNAYTPHKAFSYSAYQKTGNFGDNAPIAVIEHATYVNEEGTKTLGLDGVNSDNMLPSAIIYTGQLGEQRNSDLSAMKMSLKYDGKEIATDFMKLAEFSWQWDAEKHLDGEYSLTLINENIEVDGLKGKNLTTVDFDYRKDDRSAPTLTMLQFRNADNAVTNRFDNAADGRLTLSAADFSFEYLPEWYGGVFTDKPADIKVEYSPYGKDAWLPLEVAENAEYYQTPGFGNFYEGSLSPVASEGWHDLRITLSDASGNRQQQTISPAFRIGDNGGVANASMAKRISAHLSEDGIIRIMGTAAASASIYNAAGALVAQSADGVASPISMASLPAGIYVAKITTGSHSTTIKLIK